MQVLCLTSVLLSTVFLQKKSFFWCACREAEKEAKEACAGAVCIIKFYFMRQFMAKKMKGKSRTRRFFRRKKAYTKPIMRRFGCFGCFLNVIRNCVQHC